MSAISWEWHDQRSGEGSARQSLEISWNGTEPVELPGGVKRTFLEDGDSLVMRGWCQGDGYRVGFGEVEGTILTAD